MSGRREFFASSLKMLCLCTGGGFLAALALQARDKYYLRPPGAENEERFLSLCIRCGLCVDACPYDTLKLATLKDAPQQGTPFFEARKTPCYLCDDIPCISKCPTNALDKSYLKKEKGVLEVKMGTAIVDSTNCIAYWGIRCEACYRACPLIDKALKIEMKHNERTEKHAFFLPVVDNEFCVGCGKCEQACVTQKAAITILAQKFVLGQGGSNYVRGWDNKGEDKLKNAPTKNLPTPKQNQRALDYLNEGDLL